MKIPFATKTKSKSRASRSINFLRLLYKIIYLDLLGLFTLMSLFLLSAVTDLRYDKHLSDTIVDILFWPGRVQGYDFGAGTIILIIVFWSIIFLGISFLFSKLLSRWSFLASINGFKTAHIAYFILFFVASLVSSFWVEPSQVAWALAINTFIFLLGYVAFWLARSMKNFSKNRER